MIYSNQFCEVGWRGTMAVAAGFRAGCGAGFKNGSSDRAGAERPARDPLPARISPGSAAPAPPAGQLVSA